MNENMSKLVSALRSEEYPQGRLALKEKEKYCCLGVACDVYLHNVGGYWTSKESFETFTDITSDSDRASPPQDVMEWYGMSGKQMNTLMGLNDESSWTFSAIATYIEENF